MYSGHNRLRDATAAECRSAGWPVALEVPLTGALQRQADVLISLPDGTAPVAADVSVTHPLQLSLSTAEVVPGAFADRAEADKRRVSAAGCSAAGWRFTPVCVETTGAWGPEAQRLVRALVRRQSMRLWTPVEAAVGAVWRSLTAEVAKWTAQMLVRAYQDGSCCGAGVAHGLCWRGRGG